MDLFNKEATQSEKAFLKNRMRAVFGSTEMMVHVIIKALLALFFLIGGFSSPLKVMGCLFFLTSAASSFIMLSKMMGEKKYSPLGAKIYSVLTLVESIAVKIFLVGYCAFIISSMLGFSVFGAKTEEAAMYAYKMGFWCIPVVFAVCFVLGNFSKYFRYQRKFAENVYDCIDAELVFYSTENTYAFMSYIYALVVLVYNVFKMICPSWYSLNLFPVKFAQYLDSGIIIGKYNALTFIAFLLLSAHFVLAGRVAMKYKIVVKKLEKRINENHVKNRVR